jgi:hypothetical protein
MREKKRLSAAALDYLLYAPVQVGLTAITAAVEALQRVLLGIHQHDLAERSAAVVRDCPKARDRAQATHLSTSPPPLFFRPK